MRTVRTALLLAVFFLIVALLARYLFDSWSTAGWLASAGTAAPIPKNNGIAKTAQDSSQFTPEPDGVDSQETVKAEPTGAPGTLTIRISSTPTPTPAALDGGVPGRRTTATPEPVTPPQTQTLPASATVQPRADGHVLFLDGKELKLWDPVQLQVESLASNVSDFSASASGLRIILQRGKRITANGVELFDLALFDRESRRITILIDEAPRLANLTISPDGQWVAYAALKDGGPLFVLPTHQSGEPIQIGACLEEPGFKCTEAVQWSSDSRAVLWTDSRGVWRNSVKQATPHLVLGNILDISDPKGETSPVRVIYHSLNWSPAGRYALVSVMPVRSEVGWQGLIDTRSGRIVEVPDSYAFRLPSANAAWTEQGKLLVVHNSDPQTGRLPNAQLYQILPTRADLLGLEKSFDLQVEELVEPQALASTVPDLRVDWLAQTSPYAFVLGVMLPEISLSPFLCSLDLRFGGLQKIRDIPFDAGLVAWSPNGSSALILGLHDQVIYAPPRGAALLDLRPSLGEKACCFQWIP